MSPSLAVELARLLLSGATRDTLEACLAHEPGGPSLDSILALGERARRAGASHEQTALALGLLSALGAGSLGEASAP